MILCCIRNQWNWFSLYKIYSLENLSNFNIHWTILLYIYIYIFCSTWSSLVWLVNQPTKYKLHKIKIQYWCILIFFLWNYLSFVIHSATVTTWFKLLLKQLFFIAYPCYIVFNYIHILTYMFILYEFLLYISIYFVICENHGYYIPQLSLPSIRRLITHSWVFNKYINI